MKKSTKNVDNSAKTWKISADFVGIYHLYYAVNIA
jgi:hypothetical protein